MLAFKPIVGCGTRNRGSPGAKAVGAMPKNANRNSKMAESQETKKPFRLMGYHERLSTQTNKHPFVVSQLRQQELCQRKSLKTVTKPVSMECITVEMLRPCSEFCAES
jgi:hypothetical protein